MSFYVNHYRDLRYDQFLHLVCNVLGFYDVKIEVASCNKNIIICIDLDIPGISIHIV